MKDTAGGEPWEIDEEAYQELCKGEKLLVEDAVKIGPGLTGGPRTAWQAAVSDRQLPDRCRAAAGEVVDGEVVK